jgi:hypothetical protein
MPRPPPLEPITIPQVERRQQLSRKQKRDYAGLLGFSRLTDDIAAELAHWIACARTTRSIVVGLTRQRVVDELKRCAKKLRRGPNMRVRQKLANPALGLDTETFLRLKPLMAAPTDELLAAIEARAQELELEKQVDPQRQALESAGGTATWLFMSYAADNVRDEPAVWWRFVLAFLNDATFPTGMLYPHPESLRPLLALMKSQYQSVTQWHCLQCGNEFVDQWPPTCPVCHQSLRH